MYSLPISREMTQNRGSSPWRKSPAWNSETLDSLKADIRSFCPPACRDIKHVNILLIGPINAGKSSFFNTISSIFKDRLSSQACCGSAEKSITTTFRNYPVRDKSSEKFLPFRLCDTRGLEEAEMLDEQELNYVLNGNICDGYKHGSILKKEQKKQTKRYKLKKLMGHLSPKFLPNDQIPGFRLASAYESEVHCVCFVLDGSTADVMTVKMVDNIKMAQRIVRDKGVPQHFLITKVDKVCTMVNDNVSEIYGSQEILDLVDGIATEFGVPRSQVLPIKNFENEDDVSMEISILALLTLKILLSSAEDFLFDAMDRGDDVRSSDACS